MDTTETVGKRVSTIDGLRGFLALSVMFYHGLINYNYVTGEGWKAAGKLFYKPLGGVAVMFFFMITAFLFWSRLLKTAGKPDWKTLYINRFFRVAPLYTVTILAMLLIVFWRSGHKLHEPILIFARSAVHWLAFGMDDTMPVVNAFPLTIFILMGVTWSIRYEWYFYFSLVVLSVFVQLRMHMAFAIIGLTASLATMMTSTDVAWSFISAFFCGIATASLIHEGIRPRLPQWAMSGIALVALAVMFSVAITHDGVPQVVLTGVAFYLICSGASFFGVLRLKAAGRLGHTSYGIYLMQGLPMTLLFWNERFKTWAVRSADHYWISLFLCAFVLCILSALTYVLIERPFIAIGKHLGKMGAGRIPGSPHPHSH
ncbi:acyltransferase family protein [Paraburkholderia megapolitana]|uniref:acyltransferase family protein n=1 Tax=Paraburkholderia megapolitana TaxID=420953 RepID=UPI0038BDD28A